MLDFNFMKTHTFRPWYKEAQPFWDKDVVIVLDKSTSMQAYLQSTKASIIAVLRTLKATDRVSILTYY